MKTDAQVIHEFVLMRLDSEPLALRQALYRALAGMAATPSEKRNLIALADECEAIDRKHQQLVLDFQRAAL